MNVMHAFIDVWLK